MIEPSILALFAPGAGTQRKPTMTMTADSALVFDQIMQRSPTGGEDSAASGISEVMNPVPSASSDIAVLKERFGGFAIPPAERRGFDFDSAQNSLGSEFNRSSVMHFSYVELKAVSISASTLSMSDLTTAVPTNPAPAAPTDLQGLVTEVPAPVLPQATPAMTDLVSRPASESGNHLAVARGITDQPSSAMARLSIEATVAPIAGTVASPPEPAAFRPDGVAVPASGLPLPKVSTTPTMSAEGPAGRRAGEAGRTANVPQESSIGQRKAGQSQAIISVPSPDIGPSRSAESAIDRSASAAPQPNRAFDSPPPQLSHHPGLSVAQSTPAATPLAESVASRAEAPAWSDDANATPVVMSRVKPTAEMVTQPALGAKESDIALPTDRPQSSMIPTETAPQNTANRPTPGELTVAPAAPPPTPIPTQSDVPSPLIDAVIDLVSVEAQRSAQSATEVARATPSLAEHAPRVIESIANAARALADRPIELVLNPEELGRLKMTLLSSENGMVVQLTVERPETLELLRRHIDLLASDLRQAGYERLTFGFSSDQQTGGRSQQGDSSATAAEKELTDLAEAAQIPLSVDLTLSGDGLDLRL